VDAPDILKLVGAVLLFVGGVVPYWRQIQGTESAPDLDQVAKELQRDNPARDSGWAMERARPFLAAWKAGRRRTNMALGGAFVLGTILTIVGTVLPEDDPPPAMPSPAAEAATG